MIHTSFFCYRNLNICLSVCEFIVNNSDDDDDDDVFVRLVSLVLWV